MSLKNVNSFTEGVGCWVLWPYSRYSVVDNACQILPLSKAARAIFVNSCLSILLTYSQHFYILACIYCDSVLGIEIYNL